MERSPARDLNRRRATTTEAMMSYSIGVSMFVLALVSILAQQLAPISLAKASEVQPPNQAPNNNNNNNNAQGHQQASADFASQSSAGGQSAPASAPIVDQRLPKINIYMNKHEVKKLLGIDTRINYVTNGNINTYPLGFTIPLGYNQSDIIFTWQNLGQTNVNYSIIMTVSNNITVETPIINITRSGLIPKQEQVFKITLPCTGKVTDEVDVQVLINIVGFVDDDEDELAAAAAAASASQFEASGQLGSALSAQSSGGGQEANNSVASLEGTSASFIQSDQAESPKPRLVSHTLAIKRKKICTMQPVQVSMRPRVVQPMPVSPYRPATQQAPLHHQYQQQQQQPQQPVVVDQRRYPQAPPQSYQPEPANRWPHLGSSTGNEQQQQQQPAMQTQTNSKETRLSVAAAGAASSSSGNSNSGLATTPAIDNNDPLEASTRKLEQLNLIPAPPARGPSAPSAATAGARSDTNYYPNWPHPVSRSAPIPPENPLNDIIMANRHTQQQQQQQQSAGNNNPLLLPLFALTLLVFAALVVVVILGSSHRTPPLVKLGALTSRILRRTPASHHHHHHSAANKCKSPIASTVIGALHAGPKSSASSVSGLSAISGQSLSKLPAYCYKTNCTAAGYYGASSGGQYQQQHRYQHPPTADLLGTGYQCQPAAAAAAAPPQYPIYHIATGNNSQTTRLIWNNGNGTSPDGFTIDGGSYMPLSNAPRSDSGSVYQTIY